MGRLLVSFALGLALTVVLVSSLALAALGGGRRWAEDPDARRMQALLIVAAAGFPLAVLAVDRLLNPRRGRPEPRRLGDSVDPIIEGLRSTPPRDAAG